MTDITSNNKRIAKNTLALYFRMFLVLGVSLYTSRVVLNVLGISDYGIYNVVGGFVSMLAYLNAVCVGASQRFMSFALGKGDIYTINKTFSTTRIIHILLAIIILMFAESFGLWFINHKLVIDPLRMTAANWVYQCSLVSLFITIISIPYTASIVAHEHMHVYAYVSILDVILKLLILYLLVIIPADHLVVYAILHAVISILIMLVYRIYSRRHFAESRVKACFDKPLFKEIFSFAGWSALGTLGFSFKDQFSNIILNGFFGTTINAARGIALQVNGALSSFSDNFFTAIKPQIVKQYASGNIDISQALVYAGARYSFYLQMIVTIPIIINIDDILKIWLVNVPVYTSEFLVITLLSSLIYSLSTSISTAIQATGNIKLFQIGVSIIMLLELPTAYMILKFGANPPMAVVPVLFTTTLAMIFRFYVLKKQVPSYSYHRYYINTVFPCLGVSVFTFIVCYWINRYMPSGLWGGIFSILMCVVISCIVVFFAGINKKERQLITSFVLSKIKNATSEKNHID